YAFRGLSNKDYELTTTLIRLGGNYYDLETHLLRNFAKYARIDGAGAYSFWDWLVLARHHGLPTRLLDWTLSPFVAMHFATADTARYESDGVIWCVDTVHVHRSLPVVLQAELKREGAYVFTVEMLSNVSRSLKTFDELSHEAFVLFFEPPSANERIINQFALHSVISDPRAVLLDILAKRPESYKRVIIPSSLKWEIRDKLDQANINERVVFPGLDGLCKWLARHYGPR
ncbi:MAG TPA: FRG domain-containing protein, partial [Planctomycetota bacterium]|nr:FRG domain-containing protein [Planctomycetota bacterium]